MSNIDQDSLTPEIQFRMAAAYKIKDLFGDYLGGFIDGASDDEIADQEEALSNMSNEITDWFIENIAKRTQ